MLGTQWTMESELYPRVLARNGLQAKIPDQQDREAIQAVTFAELVHGAFTEDARNRFTEIIGVLQDNGCDAVALVCTGFPLLVSAETSPLPVLDSTVLLAHAAVDVATGRKPMPGWRGGPFTD